jgi:hypothetical protein
LFCSSGVVFLNCSLFVSSRLFVCCGSAITCSGMNRGVWCSGWGIKSVGSGCALGTVKSIKLHRGKSYVQKI